MIIELLGKPGSGKSTLNHLLENDLKSNGCAAIGFEDALKMRFKKNKAISAFVDFISIRHLQTFHALWSGKCIHKKFYKSQNSELVKKVEYLLDEIKLKCPGEFKLRKSWLEFKIRQYSLFKEITNDANLIALSDEGIASSIGNLFVYNSQIADITRIKSFLLGWPLPDMLIAVEAETTCCVHRLKKRGLPEFLKNKPDVNIVTGLENQALLDKIITEEAHHRDIPVFYIANEYSSVERFKKSPNFKSLVNKITSSVLAADCQR